MHGFIIKSTNGECFIVNYFTGDETNIGIVPIEAETATQFTGLKDRNSREIYEGDIVKCTEVNGDKITEYTSKVFHEDCSWLVEENENCQVELGMFADNPNKMPLTEIKVIGDSLND